MASSVAEDMLAAQFEEGSFPAFIRQFMFCPGRRFPADFAFPDERLLVEVQGGNWTGGRHTRGAGYEEDCVRMALALAHGWRMQYVTPSQVKSGQAIAMVKMAIEQRAPDAEEN